ncbi:MAG: antibiotic biosynthesis monooxygenase [Pseudomonadota bacterium]
MTYRIQYSWRVPMGRKDEFLAAWARTTDAIHAATPGARGSLCLRAAEDSGRFITQAVWDDLDQWRAFVRTARGDQMRAMHEIATLESTEAFELVEDRTR